MYSGDSIGSSTYLTLSTASSATNNLEALRLDSSQNAKFAGNVFLHNRTTASSATPVMLDLGGQYTADASISQANLKLKLYSSSTNDDAMGITAGASGLSFVGAINSDHIFYTTPSGSSVGTLHERLRIHRDGNVIVEEHLQVKGTGTANKFETTSTGTLISGLGNEQRFTDTTVYSATTGARKGAYIFNEGSTDGGYASLELGAKDAQGYFGSTILSSIATGTDYANDFVIQTRHLGNYKESLRMTSEGHITVAANVSFPDAKEARFGDNGELQLFQESSATNLSRIYSSSNSSGLVINSDLLTLKNEANNKNYIKCTNSGNVDIYGHGATAAKLSTTATGVTVSDNLVVSGGATFGAADVLFNCTSLPSTSVAGAGFERNGSQAILFSSSGSHTGSANHAEFKNANGTVGTINTNGSATTYNTSSDYRLKENEVAISDGITRLKTLKPYRFNFKTTPSETVDGFFAHEVTPAVPEAIVGEKDGAKMQGIDQSKLVPLLTAALQEAIAKIETLETKVAALEAG